MAAQELQITIVSAKHLKNVNWRYGDLRPYTTVWLVHDHRLTTKPDEFNSTKPIWNEHFLIPLPFPPSRAVLNLEIRHDKAPLVGTLRLRLKDLPDPENYNMIRTFDIVRPSGRPHGKIRLKLAFPESALTSPVIPEEILMMEGWIDEDGPELKFHFTHQPPPDGVAPEDWYPWFRPRKSKNNASTDVKDKGLEADDKSKGHLAENRWFNKLKKLLDVFNKKRIGPTDPLVERLIM